MWRQAASTVLGIWLMASPAVLGYGGLAANVSWVLGPLIASISFMAAFAIARPLRLLNILFAGGLVISPLVTIDIVASINAVVVGAAVATLAARTPRVSMKTYGGGWRVLLSDPADST